MHNLLLVTIRKEIARNSKEARAYTYKWLADNKLACQDSAFCSGMADWFVIGGRWSGWLTLLHLEQERLDRFLDEFDKKYGWYIGAGFSEQDRSQQSIRLFNKYFPEFRGKHPFWRNLSALGADDDAMICDDIIFEMMIKKA